MARTTTTTEEDAAIEGGGDGLKGEGCTVETNTTTTSNRSFQHNMLSMPWSHPQSLTHTLTHSPAE